MIMQIVPPIRGSVESKTLPTSKAVTFVSLVLLAIAVLFHGTAEAKVYKPGPETNLSDLSVRLKTGDVVKLGPYRYYGQLLIEKKSITVRGAANGKTSLYDPAIQALVFVGTGGSIVIDDIRFKLGGQSQTAVHVKGGKAVINRCVIKRSKKQPIYVENGELEVHKCRFSSISEEVISATGTSKVLIHGSTFTDIKSKAVVLQNGAQATVRKSSFTGIGNIALLALSKSKVYIVSSRFTNIKNTALQAEQESEISVALSSFSGIGKFGLIAVNKSIARVKNSQFKNSKGIAVVGNQAAELSVADSRFNNVEQIVFVGKQGTHVSVSGNKVNKTNKTKTAIAIEFADSILISKNLLLNVGEGISVNGTGNSSSLVIENNTIVNSARSSLAFSVTGSSQRASVMSNRFINSRKPSVLLGNKANVNFSKNIILARSTVGIYVRDNASIQFSDNVIFGADKSVFFHSSASPGSRLVRNMLISVILKSTRHSAIIPDSQFSYLTQNAENKRVLTEDINKLLLNADSVNTFADIGKVNSDVQSLQTRIASLKSQVGQLASITVKATDVAGREFIPAYTVYNVYDAVVSRHDSNNPVATVPPGSYYIKSDIGDRSKKEVTLVAGQAGKVVVPAPKYRVLGLMNFDIRKGWSTVWVPFLFRSIEQRRRSFPKKHYNWAVRRSNTTVTDLVGALDQVRAKLPGLRSEYSRIAVQLKNTSSSAAKKKLARWDNAISWAHNILAIAGNAGDAKQLVSLASRVPEIRQRRLALAAYIENRLGILGKGSVLSAIGSTNSGIRIQAALLLRQFGRSEGDEILTSTLAAALNTSLTAQSAKALLSLNKPAVLAAMRQVVQAFIRQRQALELKAENITYPKHLWDTAATASIYLYTWGSKDDAQLAAKITFRKSQLIPLARLVKDPRALADFYMGFRGASKIYYKPRWAAGLCNSLQYLPASDLSRFDTYFEGLLVRAASANKISKKSRLNDISLARSQYNVAKSLCRANTVTARLVFKQKTGLLGGTPWIAKSWLYNKNLSQLKRGNPFVAPSLDHAAHGILVGSLSTVSTNDKLRYPDLLLAYHGIGKRQCQFNKCGFVITHKQSPHGALAGVLRIRSVKSNRRGLNVQLSFDLAAHNDGGSTTEGHPTSFGKYMSFGGRDLVAEVYIKNSDRKVRLRKVIKGSVLKYSLSKSKFSTNNTYLYVRVRMFNEWREFGFPLFMYK